MRNKIITMALALTVSMSGIPFAGSVQADAFESEAIVTDAVDSQSQDTDLTAETDSEEATSHEAETSEIDPHTMESRLCPGLYFAGELMDVDGTCGGYNLQWAWSSGACAGLHSAGVTGSSYKQGENI